MNTKQSILEGRGLGVGEVDGGAPPLPGSIDVAIAEGDVLVVAGASGSGKTTLLRCLAMLEADAAGDVRFRGAPVADSDVPAFRRRVVYLAQSPPRFPMSVRRSLAAAFDLRSSRAEFEPERAAAMARRLLLPDHLMKQSLADLSGGEAQRVAIIRGLLLDPAVLLLDEPTSALDPEAREAVISELREWLSSGGRAAVLVSHDAALSSALATRRAVLRDGELIERETA